MVIDFHVHCFPDDLAPKAVPKLAECANISPYLDGTVSSIKKSMKRSGVKHSVVLSIATKPSQTTKVNDWSAGIQDKDITAFGSVHPDFKGWESELARIKELGLKGIKLHPEYQSFYVDDKKMFPIYEKAFDLGLAILFHAGEDLGFPPPFHCKPEGLLKVVRAFPGRTIIAAHMGGYSYWDDVEKYLVGEDIYFDTSYCVNEIDDSQLKRIINNHDFKKVLFATDSPWKEQSEGIEQIKSLNLESRVEKAILGENAINLLGIGA